jgi:hypothetical protein
MLVCATCLAGAPAELADQAEIRPCPPLVTARALDLGLDEVDGLVDLVAELVQLGRMVSASLRTTRPTESASGLRPSLSDMTAH